MNAERQALVARSIPLQRIGHPDDIAAAVVYFASPAASWVTGQLLLVAGGEPTELCSTPPTGRDPAPSGT